MRGIKQDQAILQRNDLFWRYRLYDELPTTVVTALGVVITPGVVSELTDWNWEARYATTNEDGVLKVFDGTHFTLGIYSQEDDQRPWMVFHLTPAETGAMSQNGVYQIIATHKTLNFRQEVAWGSYSIQKAVGGNG